MTSASARAYLHALEAGGRVVGESPAAFADMPELEWQARWFAGEFGREWIGRDGIEIRILDFGRWNREAGPDFVDARLRIGREETTGDIELDPDVRDWERHGHATNAGYRQVVLHVFLRQPDARFFTRTVDHREVTQLQLPTASRTRPRATPDPEIACDGSHSAAILHAAARHRLDGKARALRRYAAAHGEDASWFAATATALGYRRNQTPFLLLAQRIGHAAASAPAGEAMLFGLAGFLEDAEPPAADRDVRSYLRGLWEDWWSRRAGCEKLILPAAVWRYSGARPANHPHRRVAALARIAAAWPVLRDALAHGDQAAFAARLESLDHPFWQERCNLRADPLDRPQALVGPDRIRDFLINIFHPLALGRDDGAWADFVSQRGPAPAGIMRETARKFFGEDHSLPLSHAVIQQGLLQLERDHRHASEPAGFLAALRQIS